MSPQLVEWLRQIDDKRLVVSRSVLERVIVELRKLLEERAQKPADESKE